MTARSLVVPPISQIIASEILLRKLAPRSELTGPLVKVKMGFY